MYYSGITDDTDYTVSVATGYLALRTEKAYDYRNEIGKLYTGDTVEVIDSSDSGYWYVYSYKLNKYGYVNKDYLIAPVTVCGPEYYVTGTTYYLALRNAKAYDAANEIGKLHNGDYVYVHRKCGYQTGLDTLVVHTVNDEYSLLAIHSQRPSESIKYSTWGVRRQR